MSVQIQIHLFVIPQKTVFHRPLAVQREKTTIIRTYIRIHRLTNIKTRLKKTHLKTESCTHREEVKLLRLEGTDVSPTSTQSTLCSVPPLSHRHTAGQPPPTPLPSVPPADMRTRTRRCIVYLGRNPTAARQLPIWSRSCSEAAADRCNGGVGVGVSI